MRIPKQAVSLCGGLGSRLMPYTANTPKPLVLVNGKPFIEYQMEWAFAQGIEEFVILAGRFPEQFEKLYGATQGVKVVPQPAEWETGRRLKEAASLLQDRFLILYNDNFAPVSLSWLTERHEEAGLVHHQKPALTVTMANKTEEEIKEIGYAIAERDRVLHLLKHSFELSGPFWDTIRWFGRSGELRHFAPGGLFYHSIGDPERLALIAEYLKPKKVILLDRDGVINRKPPKAEYVTKIADFSWLDENIDGLAELSNYGFEFIVITNQAGIGRGVCSDAVVRSLNDYMVGYLLGWKGIHIRDVLVCPHSWEQQPPCSCRKPLPGLFFQAAQKHNLRLDRTIYVGDDERDAVAAERATCAFCLVNGNINIKNTVPFILKKFMDWGIA